MGGDKQAETMRCGLQEEAIPLMGRLKTIPPAFPTSLFPLASLRPFRYTPAIEAFYPTPGGKEWLRTP